MSFGSLAVSFLILLAACSDTIGPEDLSGRYLLESIDGESLPFLAANHNFWGYNHLTTTTELYEVTDYEITEGRRDLDPGGTCSTLLLYRRIHLDVKSNAETVTVHSYAEPCEWTFQRGKILFFNPWDPPDTASVTGQVLTTTTVKPFRGPRMNLYGDVARWLKAVPSG